jgi:ribosomal protein S18 acetylase RimI-like enzyme
MSHAAWAERLAAACLEGARGRALSVEDGEVVEIDGLALALSNLPTEELNSAAVSREPSDPRAALAAAEDEFRRRGHAFFGIELERGRHPSVEAAVRDAGLTRLFSRPLMAAAREDLATPTHLDGVQIEPVEEEGSLAELRSVDLEAFGGDPAITELSLGPRLLALGNTRMFLARLGGVAVGEGAVWLLSGTVGIFGIGVMERARRRGIGGALTLTAAHAFGDRADVAWLLPTEMARPLYEGLGFRSVSEWEVWVRAPAEAAT